MKQQLETTVCRHYASQVPKPISGAVEEALAKVRGLCDDAVAVIANSKENDLRIETVKGTRELLHVRGRQTS